MEETAERKVVDMVREASPRSLGLVLVASLLAAGAAHAQLGQGDEVPEVDVQADTVLDDESPKRFVWIDNTYWGGPDSDSAIERFEAAGWDTDYDEDSSKEGFLEELQDRELVYIIAHGGLSDSTGEVGLTWDRNLRPDVTVLASDIAEHFRTRNAPKMVIISGCKTAHNATMARAFGGAFVGFDEDVLPVVAYPFAAKMLEEIAGGSTIEAAFAAANAALLGTRPVAMMPPLTDTGARLYIGGERHQPGRGFR